MNTPRSIAAVCRFVDYSFAHGCVSEMCALLRPGFPVHGDVVLAKNDAE